MATLRLQETGGKKRPRNGKAEAGARVFVAQLSAIDLTDPLLSEWDRIDTRGRARIFRIMLF